MTALELDIVLKNFEKLKKKLESVVIGKTGNETGVSSGGGNSGGNKKGKGGAGLFLAGGVLGVLAGILSQLSSITGLIKVVTSLINSLVAPLVPLILTVLRPVFILLGFLSVLMIKFFKNPLETLLKLGVFIVNGILAGIELLINTIRGIFGFEAIELPRFQEQLVLKAFQDYTNTVGTLTQNGELTAKKAMAAQIEFSKGIINSFVTNSKFAKAVEVAIGSGLSETETLGLILDVGATNTISIVERGFNNLNRLINLLDSESRASIQRIKQRNSGVFRGIRSGPKQNFTPVPREESFFEKALSNKQINITNNITAESKDDASFLNKIGSFLASRSTLYGRLFR